MAFPAPGVFLLASLLLRQESVVPPAPRLPLPRPVANAPLARVNDNRRPAGTLSAGTLSASRKSRTAAAGSTGDPLGSNPRRFTYSCPSANRSRTRCAQWTANAVLPTPAVPDTTAIATGPD